MPDAELTKEIFNYGTPLVILAAVVWGLIRISRWASGIINNAIFDSESGWLTISNRNAESLRRSVETSEKYFEQQTKNEQVQQSLCQQHAEGLHQITDALTQHLEISRATLNGLEQLRQDARDPAAPFSTVVTNHKLDNISASICHACQAIKRAVQHTNPEIANQVSHDCETIEELLRRNPQ